MKNKKIKNDFIIRDWTGNLCFFGKDFPSFEDAEEFLSEKLDEDYETDRQEYYIVLKNEEN